MFLIEVFIPLNSSTDSGALVKELAEEFGGATAHIRFPAIGLWRDEHSLEVDRIGIVEVMTDDFNRERWRQLKKRSGGTF